ncbi:MAG: hypothetical protein CW338_00295 [Clostridiales bacterium]|nr:hypothetical protein [Clostridiales bacterium]
MTERFLRYSLTHNRPVRILHAGTMKFQNVTVVAMDGETFSYLSAKNRKIPVTCPLSDVLSAGYARGDKGDTLENSLREESVIRAAVTGADHE